MAIQWFNIMGIIGFSVFFNNESASVKELILGPNCNFGANTKTEITSKNKHRWSHNVPVIPSQNLSRIAFISNFKLDMFMLIMIRIIRRYFFFKDHEFLWKPNAMLQIWMVARTLINGYLLIFITTLVLSWILSGWFRTGIVHVHVYRYGFVVIHPHLSLFSMRAAQVSPLCVLQWANQ